MKLDLRNFFIAALAATTLFFSCSPDEDPQLDVDYLFSMDSMDETYDKVNSIKAGAVLVTLKLDTIAEYGFIYTDAIEYVTGQEPTPKYGIDHTIRSTDIVADPNDKTRYIFTSLINPKRPFYVNGGVVSVVSYLKSKSGKVYLSERVSLYGNEPTVMSVYPSYAKAGADVLVTFNQPVSTGNFAFDIDSKLSLLINGKMISYDLVDPTSGYSYNVRLTMPENISAETPLVTKIGSYEVSTGFMLKNTQIGFSSLTKFKRENVQFDPFLFLYGSAIYFGGGSYDANKDGAIVSSETKKDFWKYDIAGNSWKQMADYQGLHESPMTFISSDNAYVGGPHSMNRYSAGTDKWDVMKVPTTGISYDHTHYESAVGVVANIAYFTNYTPEITYGGISYHNFYEYNPSTDVYKSLPGYPGKQYYTNGKEARAVFYNSGLHFFPGLEHWTYSITSKTWTRLSDVPFDADYTKPFMYKDNLYLVRYKYDRPNFKRYVQAYRYVSSTDKWERDSDIPSPSDFMKIYPMNSDRDLYFGISSGDYGTMTLYKTY